MCRYYQTTRKPAYTRLCYLYRELKGAHVPGEYRCGEYPKPSRRRSNSTKRPAPPNSMCLCGAPAVSSDRKCEKCYVFDQILALPDTARTNVSKNLIQDAEEHQQKRQHYIDARRRSSENILGSRDASKTPRPNPHPHSRIKPAGPPHIFSS